MIVLSFEHANSVIVQVRDQHHEVRGAVPVNVFVYELRRAPVHFVYLRLYVGNQLRHTTGIVERNVSVKV